MESEMQLVETIHSTSWRTDNAMQTKFCFILFIWTDTSDSSLRSRPCIYYAQADMKRWMELIQPAAFQHPFRRRYGNSNRTKWKGVKALLIRN